MLACALPATMKRNLRLATGMLLATALLAAGCSSLRGGASPSAEEKRQAALAEQLQALQLENQALHQQQAQSQRQLEALTQQLAQEQDAERKFRLMMSTNFDLLERSVTQSLAKPATLARPATPTAAPAGSGSPGTSGTTAGASASPAAPPALSAAPSGKSVPAAAIPTAAISGAAATSAADPPGQPAVAIPAADAASAAKEAEPAASNPASPLLRAVPLVGKPSLIGTATSESAPQAQAARTAEQRDPPRQAQALLLKPPLALSAAVLPAAAADSERRMGAAAQGQEQPLEDPDLRAPAHPKQLSANRAAKPLYDKGFALYGSGQYDQALLVYENFLSRYPQDLYSDNAQFWIGECYLRLNRLDEAEAAYRKVLREYEHKSTLEGYKTPDAIYRLAQVYERRHDERRARYYLQAVAERFPDSASGQRARRNLQNPGGLMSQLEGAHPGAGG